MAFRGLRGDKKRCLSLKEIPFYSIGLLVVGMVLFVVGTIEHSNSAQTTVVCCSEGSSTPPPPTRPNWWNRYGWTLAIAGGIAVAQTGLVLFLVEGI